MQDAYEAEDEIDDAADDAAEAQHRRSRAAAVASGSQLPDHSAYFHERLYWSTNTRATWHNVLMQLLLCANSRPQALLLHTAPTNDFNWLTCCI